MAISGEYCGERGRGARAGGSAAARPGTRLPPPGDKGAGKGQVGKGGGPGWGRGQGRRGGRGHGVEGSRGRPPTWPAAVMVLLWPPGRPAGACPPGPSGPTPPPRGESRRSRLRFGSGRGAGRSLRPPSRRRPAGCRGRCSGRPRRRGSSGGGGRERARPGRRGPHLPSPEPSATAHPRGREAPSPSATRPCHPSLWITHTHTQDRHGAQPGRRGEAPAPSRGAPSVLHPSKRPALPTHPGIRSRGEVPARSWPPWAPRSQDQGGTAGRGAAGRGCSGCAPTLIPAPQGTRPAHTHVRPACARPHGAHNGVHVLAASS